MAVSRRSRRCRRKKRELIENSELLVYVCTGTEAEIKEWFQTIMIAGVPLNDQELRNAIYSGPFVTAARAEYTNSNNALHQKWSAYVKGNPKRQEVPEIALKWVAASKGKSIEAYMGDRGLHRRAPQGHEHRGAGDLLHHRHRMDRQRIHRESR